MDKVTFDVLYDLIQTLKDNKAIDEKQSKKLIELLNTASTI